MESSRNQISSDCISLVSIICHNSLRFVSTFNWKSFSKIKILFQAIQYKLWVKPSSEMSFLYGKHILKAGLGRISENTPKYQGVVVYSMADVPLGIFQNWEWLFELWIILFFRNDHLFTLEKPGFGLTAYSSQEMRRADPTSVVCFNQADTGEYLRNEEILWKKKKRKKKFCFLHLGNHHAKPTESIFKRINVLLFFYKSCKTTLIIFELRVINTKSYYDKHWIFSFKTFVKSSHCSKFRIIGG